MGTCGLELGLVNSDMEMDIGGHVMWLCDL